MIFRNPDKRDYQRIARLHALSWQKTYPDILSKDYLAHQVLDDKQALWYQRLNNANKNQWVLIAEQDQMLAGFVCIFLAQHPQFGAYMDNLHVYADLKGMGLGKRLFKQACRYIHRTDPDSGLYLWVYQANTPALDFYLKCGGKILEIESQSAPGGGTVKAARLVWNELAGQLE